MINPKLVIADAFGNLLVQNYQAMFGPEEPTLPTKLNVGARFTVELIANSDALYHDVEHTVFVTLVGQAIFRGRFLRERLTPHDWVHYTTALLCHDIGYVRGVCSKDVHGSCVIDAEGTMVDIPRGASDAFLTPYHVDRAKIFVRERFASVPHVDEEWIARSIELTRFPVPSQSDGSDESWASLVRAADLIGQLADPNYPQKLTALFYEFAETGVTEKLGYETAADLADNYPKFYWTAVRPYITEALGYLEMTQEGKQWIANLHSHVFSVEHKERHFGPGVGSTTVPV